jgi:CBS domain-containing membrane protein
MPVPPVDAPKPRFRPFAPILAGATLSERVLACLAAFIAIGLTALASGALFGGGLGAALIVAPMGASAVLVFAVPSSPLAQPWPVVGGNAISALAGVAVARFVPDPVLAVGLAVGLAIAAMSLTRSLHPPGGAAALTAVIGGPAVAAAGFLFPLVPVAANAIVLVAAGVVFHRLSGRSYPHRVPDPVNPHATADAPPERRSGVQRTDVDAALGALHETFDIEEADLVRLIGEIERQALLRAHGGVTCAGIMSRDVVMVDLETPPAAAQALLLRHNIRTLPVVDGEGRLLGTVGLRELAEGAQDLAAALSPARSARPDDAAVSLLPRMTDGLAHAVVITDAERRVVGLVTQTDLLAALGHALAAGRMAVPTAAAA